MRASGADAALASGAGAALAAGAGTPVYSAERLAAGRHGSPRPMTNCLMT